MIKMGFAYFFDCKMQIKMTKGLVNLSWLVKNTVCLSFLRQKKQGILQENALTVFMAND